MQQAIITPVMGWKILIPLFAAVIVGGIGKSDVALIAFPNFVLNNTK